MKRKLYIGGIKLLKILDVNMNYLKNPVGIVKMPQFGWILESDKKNVVQKTYQLEIAEDDIFSNSVYDSGIVKSDESAHIQVTDMRLESIRKYYVRVKVSDNYEEESGWSETAYFVTALLQNEWEGEFISAEAEEDRNLSKGTYVRKEFTLNNKIQSAYLCATALGLYNVYLNGKKVGRDELTPGWTSYNKHLLYQTYDVTSYLKEGGNAIGAMLGAGWYKGKMGFEPRRNIYGDWTAFLGQLLITYEDGTSQTVITDSSWKGADAPVVFAEIYDGEIYDANLEIPGWNEAGHGDANWRSVETILCDKKILTPQSGCTVKMVEEFPAKAIFQTPEGDTVIDFGQNMAGWIHFKAKGETGDRVELNCFEILDAKGNVYLDNLRTAKQTIQYTFKDSSPTEYHPHFTFQGFRYAKIAAFPGTPKLENFTAYAVHSDMQRTGFFECSNPEVNQLQHNILWGLNSNFVDIPTDCPQRDERLGWTGDAQIFSRTASYLMNTYTFFSKWLVDVEADQTEDGGVAHVVPDILTGEMDDNWLLTQGTHSAAAWADAAVIVPWVLYQTYGDKVVLEKQFDSMKKWIEFMRKNSKDYIWNYKLQFGDWVALDAEEGSYFGATPNDLTCTAYFAYVTGLFAKICNVLGKAEESKIYAELYENIVQKYQAEFFDQQGNLTAQTQTAHIMTLYFGLTPEKYKSKITHSLLELLKKENNHLVTGFVGTPYFCHALSQNGCTKEAYDLLLKDDFPSWLYQVKMGATTIWEHWDGLRPDGTMWSPDMNSFNHYAYGAIGEWLYRVAAGIEIDEKNPGYKHSILYPHIGGNLDYVDASYNSVYGPVSVNWSCNENEVTLKASVPHNTTADIILDQATRVTDAAGLDFARIGNNLSAIAGSGDYVIRFIK